MTQIRDKFDIFDQIPENLLVELKSFNIFDDKYGKNLIFNLNNGDCFVFGTHIKGFCAFFDENSQNPKSLNIFRKFLIDMSNGTNFVLLLTSDNDLISWGSNEYGQLGRGFTSEKNEILPPSIVRLEQQRIEKISQICSGSFHSLLLTDKGSIFACGWNKHGQLGLGTDKDFVESFTMMNFFKNIHIIMIHCSIHKSLALTVDGSVYSWGINNWFSIFNELDARFMKDTNPRRIIELNRVEYICSSLNNIYFLSFGLIYFSGIYADDENVFQYQKTPKIIESVNKFDYLYSKNGRACAFSDNCLYSLEENRIEKTKYDNLSDFYMREFQITHKFLIYSIDSIFESIKGEVNHFRYDKLIGEGAFGKVYKITIDDIDYALKKINIKNFDDDFEKEFKIMKNLDEKYIVKVFEYIKFEKYLLIKMELCDIDLKNVIEIKSEIFKYEYLLDFLLCMVIFEEVVECVKYLHNIKPPLIHRDIKPSNILINYRESDKRFVKICDFGLSKFHEYEDQSHTRLNVPSKYHAPEVRVGAKYTTKVDIYSLGVLGDTLFENVLKEYIRSPRRNIIRRIFFYIFGYDLFLNISLKRKSNKLYNLLNSMKNENQSNRPTSEECLENFKTIRFKNEELEYINFRSAINNYKGINKPMNEILEKIIPKI